MKIIWLIVLLSVCSVTNAEGGYDGIWDAGPVGYLSIHEKNGTLIVIRLSDNYYWEAYSGELNKNQSFLMQTLVAEVQVVFNATFTSANHFSATLQSCRPLSPSVRCLFPDGFSFQGIRVW